MASSTTIQSETPPSSPPPPTSSSSSTSTPSSESIFSTSPDAQQPSLIDYLERTHTTEGIREGIATSKAISTQSGFDEGYAIGAALGIAAGEVLGIIEGICSALAKSTTSASHASNQKWETILSTAKTELLLQNICATEYFNEYGLWEWKAEGYERSWNTIAMALASDSKETVVHNIAAAHPLIVKWTKLIQEEVKGIPIRVDGYLIEKGY